jgi:hypothetical protein
MRRLSSPGGVDMSSNHVSSTRIRCLVEAVDIL